MNIRRFTITATLIAVLVVTILVAFLYTPIVKKSDLHYFLETGTSGKQLAADLHQKANLPFPKLFQLLLKLRGASHHLQSGEYLFPAGITPNALISQIIKGEIVYHPFTIVNGWTFSKVKVALDSAPALQHTLRALTPAEIAQKLGLKEKTPEGLLLPETYYYTYNMTDLEVLNIARQAMQKYLQTEWTNRAKDLPYHTPYRALIVASMVEKETALDTEKSLIAAIILKRLKIGMHLQIDSTLIYGLGDRYTGHLTRSDLRLNTPYNTYTRYGLPPTPIAMPSPASIHAALHPVQTNMLYFVSKNDGSHLFSETLKQQQEAVMRYQIKGKKDVKR